MYTMGDVARCSLGSDDAYHSEALLYRLFGVNAELLIDHAWGYEPCTIADIKAYRPENNSISSGQVLTCAYPHDKAGLVLREMADGVAMDLVDKGMVTDQLTVTVGYDVENLQDAGRRQRYKGEVVRDRYGREIPKHGHGTVRLPRKTSSARIITQAVAELYERIADPNLLIRRLTVECSLLREGGEEFRQMDLFSPPEEQTQETETLEREKRRQQAMLEIKRRFGKNAILRGLNLEEGATARERNGQIGGHKA